MCARRETKNAMALTIFLILFCRWIWSYCRLSPKLPHKPGKVAQAGHEGLEAFEVEGVGPVGEGLRGVIMNLQKERVHAGCHPGAGQGFDVLGLAAAVAARSSGSWSEWVTSRTTGAPNSFITASPRISTTRLL